MERNINRRQNATSYSSCTFKLPLPTIAVPFNKLHVAAPSSIFIFEQSVSFVKYYFKDAQKFNTQLKMNYYMYHVPLLINYLNLKSVDIVEYRN